MTIVFEVRNDNLDGAGGGGGDDVISTYMRSIWKGELLGLGSGSDIKGERVAGSA